MNSLNFIGVLVAIVSTHSVLNGRECLAADSIDITVNVNCANKLGLIRPLHGVNGGTLHAGDTVDLSPAFREISVPLARLHDCHWPNADVVDIHVLFPDFSADPSRAESYDFRRTDEYVSAIVASGAAIVFRLGESIEHTKRKYHVNPPADPDKWAAICVGVARHYNDGWAAGFHRKIRYWEIWNEPENRPAMWTGDDDQFLRLYAAATKALKKALPDVLVGGPGFGYVGELKDEQLTPTPFARKFFETCRRESAPLDFFSWHNYAGDPHELVQRARAIRALLNHEGFDKTESHLNEWSYLPNGQWGPLQVTDGHARQAWFDRQGGAEGAAFATAALMLLQDTQLDAANYYSADTQGFGMFSEHGAPKKSFFGLKAFSLLMSTPRRIEVVAQAHETTAAAKLAVCAGINPADDRLTVLASNFSDENMNLHISVAGIPWRGESTVETRLLDAKHDLEVERSFNAVPGAPIDQVVPAHGVAVINIQRLTQP